MEDIIEGRIIWLSTLRREQFYVSERKKAAALDILFYRMANGEDPFDATGINKTEGRYYLHKLLSGLTPMSDLVYYRITKRLPYSVEWVLEGMNEGERRDSMRTAISEKLKGQESFVNDYLKWKEREEQHEKLVESHS